MPKKRKYTFRKNRLIPVESGSILHEMEKDERESFRRIKKSKLLEI